MPMEIDPGRIRPMPGKLVVHVVEILGGMTPGGIFVPGTTQDHMGKDTVYGRVVSKGPPPTSRLVRDERGHGTIEQDRGPWPEAYRSRVSVGDVVLFPRDVPMAFYWGEDRYAIVLEEEAIVSIPGDQFDASSFQVVPWRPGAMAPPQ